MLGIVASSDFTAYNVGEFYLRDGVR